MVRRMPMLLSLSPLSLDRDMSLDRDLRPLDPDPRNPPTNSSLSRSDFSARSREAIFTMEIRSSLDICVWCEALVDVLDGVGEFFVVAALSSDMPLERKES
jgi:hypothetical protein